MTLAEMVAQYGEAEVVRLFETGMRVERAVDLSDVVLWTASHIVDGEAKTFYKVGFVYSVGDIPSRVYQGETLLAALEAADEA